jgi:hypothetical protein
MGKMKTFAIKFIFSLKFLKNVLQKNMSAWKFVVNCKKSFKNLEFLEHE